MKYTLHIFFNKNRKYFLLCLITIISFTGFAISSKGETVFDVSYGDPTPQGDFVKLTIPLRRVQNLFLIEARIDTLVGNFILDTGAPHLVLNKTYFRKGKLAEGTTFYGITGGGNQVFKTWVDSLIIQDMYFTEIDADLVNLGHIEDARGVKILGLLGADLFLNLEMEIDLQNNVLYLYKIDAIGNRIFTEADTNKTVADLQIPIQIENNILFINAAAGNKKLRFCLDTGAETNVLSNTVSNKVLAHFSLTNRIALSGSGNPNISVLNGKLDEVIIGDQPFYNMPFVLTNLSYLQTVYDTTINGVLGYDFIARGRVIINFKQQILLMYFYKG
ncbi:MAG: aspartyl protease family protein [Fimbriimonadaceae bacterium]|nr:aspartyl protease family protein [Chitinophagales bacterium]